MQYQYTNQHPNHCIYWKPDNQYADQNLSEHTWYETHIKPAVHKHAQSIVCEQQEQIN